MLKIGLTGGLASGKSFVGRALADLGCRLIQADEIGKQVMQPAGEAFDAIVAEFGKGILASDGTIDRGRLAAEVFENPSRLASLTRLVHPPVIRREDDLAGQIAAEDPRAIVVVEAAVMIEAGSHTRFRKLIVAACTPEQQVERAMARDRITRDEALARIARQMPLEDKLKLADYVIDTSGTEAATLRQVRELYDSLRSMA
jgi:dephospho-CoA kinase